MRACLCNLIVAVLMVGCTTTNTELDTDHQGIELHVDPKPFLTVPIVRVSIEAAGQTQDLALNPATGTFDGTLFLPAGMQSLVARAFGGDMLVGQSQPTPVEVTSGAVTRVLLRILDVTGNRQAPFGPIIDSLSFPTTADAGATMTFAASAISPIGDPVSYAWSSDCADAAFTAPSAPITGWSRPTEGPCVITLSATASGLTIAQRFAIVVFPVGTRPGAVNVDTAFVGPPSVELTLAPGCSVDANSSNASCPDPIASPATAAYTLAVLGWGNSVPGTLELSDSCGGRIGTTTRGTDQVIGNWLPPVTGGVCFLTARAVNGDGVVATATAAVLVHPGTAPTAAPPQVVASFLFGCTLRDSSMPALCGFVQPGSTRFLSGSVFWQDGHPGSVTITDSCAGPRPDPEDTSSFSTFWTAPSVFGSCTTTVRATSLEGVTTEVAGIYSIGF